MIKSADTQYIEEISSTANNIFSFLLNRSHLNFTRGTIMKYLDIPSSTAHENLQKLKAMNLITEDSIYEENKRGRPTKIYRSNLLGYLHYLKSKKTEESS